MKRILIFSFTSLVILTSCGGKTNQKNKNNQDSLKKDSVKNNITVNSNKKEEVVVVDSSDVMTHTEVLNENGQLDPNSSPTAVVQTMIKAGKTRNFGQLLKLCNEAIDMDGDAKDVCGLGGAKKSFQDEYCNFFGKARITGQPRIKNGVAEVDISTTAEGGSKETIVCQVKYDKWYLKGF
jgi:hypothetical protein